MIYYLVFRNVSKILEELHFSLTSDQAHKKVFSEVPIIGFKKAKSLKDYLVRPVLPRLDRERRSKPWEGPNRSFEVWESVRDTTKFQKAELEETFGILRGPLDSNSNNVIYLFECKKCQFKFSYVGSTDTKFRFRFSNYKNTHRKFRKELKKGIVLDIKKSELKQKKFHEHYCSDENNGIANCCTSLIDHLEDKKE